MAAVGGIEVGIARDIATQGLGFVAFDGDDNPAPIVGEFAVRVGEEPETPDKVITVRLEPGRVPDIVSIEPLVGVRVRSRSYEEAAQRIRAIEKHLREKGRHGANFGGVRARLLADGTFVPLGRDSVRRWGFEQLYSALLRSDYDFA